VEISEFAELRLRHVRIGDGFCGAKVIAAEIIGGSIGVILESCKRGNDAGV
jgi:hypothetical protein